MIMKKKDQKHSVKLKGIGKNLCLSVNPVLPLKSLKKEIRRLFKNEKQRENYARVTIDVGNNGKHEALVEKLGIFLKKEFGVNSVSRAEKKPPPKRSQGAERWVRKRDMEHSWNNYHTDVLMLSGRVRSGQKVTAKKHLVIMGDVNPGAEVMAGGDILIIGSLLGTAIAGQPDNENSIILSLDFRPTQIQIGSYVAAGLPSSPGKLTEYAHVEAGNIIVDNYLEINPFGRLPWPQVR